MKVAKRAEAAVKFLLELIIAVAVFMILLTAVFYEPVCNALKLTGCTP